MIDGRFALNKVKTPPKALITPSIASRNKPSKSANDALLKKEVQTTQGYQTLKHKEAVMEERLKALLLGKASKVLQNAWKNRKDTRIVTAVCDLAIVLKK